MAHPSVCLSNFGLVHVQAGLAWCMQGTMWGAGGHLAREGAREHSERTTSTLSLKVHALIDQSLFPIRQPLPNQAMGRPGHLPNRVCGR